MSQVNASETTNTLKVMDASSNSFESVGALIDRNSCERVRYIRRIDMSDKNVNKAQILYLTGEDEFDLMKYDLDSRFYTNNKFQKDATSMILILQ